MGKSENCKIPYPIRLALGLHAGSLISFEDIDDKSLIITREDRCQNCPRADEPQTDKIIYFNANKKAEDIYENSLVSN